MATITISVLDEIYFPANFYTREHEGVLYLMAGNDGDITKEESDRMFDSIEAAGYTVDLNHFGHVDQLGSIGYPLVAA